MHLKIMPWIFPELQTFLYLPANGIIQGMRPIIAFNYGAAHHRAGCISALTPDRSDRCLACILDRGNADRSDCICGVPEKCVGSETIYMKVYISSLSQKECITTPRSHFLYTADNICPFPQSADHGFLSQ